MSNYAYSAARMDYNTKEEEKVRKAMQAEEAEMNSDGILPFELLKKKYDNWLAENFDVDTDKFPMFTVGVFKTIYGEVRVHGAYYGGRITCTWAYEKTFTCTATEKDYYDLMIWIKNDVQELGKYTLYKVTKSNPQPHRYKADRDYHPVFDRLSPGVYLYHIEPSTFKETPKETMVCKLNNHLVEYMLTSGLMSRIYNENYVSAYNTDYAKQVVKVEDFLKDPTNKEIRKAIVEAMNTKSPYDDMRKIAHTIQRRFKHMRDYFAYNTFGDYLNEINTKYTRLLKEGKIIPKDNLLDMCIAVESLIKDNGSREFDNINLMGC